MNTIWNPDITQHGGPKYRALTDALRADVVAGVLPGGAQLPTVRDLAWRLSVTPGTVARAYQAATAEGLLKATVGRGTFVAERDQRADAEPSLSIEQELGDGTLDLRSPRLPEAGQTLAITAALRRISSDLGLDWLNYTSQDQEAPLRAAVCDWLAGRAVGPLSPDHVMLTNGGQNAIRLVFDATLTGERPVVLTEALAYPGFRYAARLARAEVVGVAMDREGLLPDAMEAACKRHHPQVLCLTPQAQNPTVACMGALRRAEIVSIAQRYNLQIVEDECYAPSSPGEETLRAMAPERTWYIGSLSKSVSAALRFGYVLCPPDRGAAARSIATHHFFALPLPLSALCLDLLRSGEADRLRAAVGVEMARRVGRVALRLGGYDLGWQPGIPFVWLRLPQGWRASSFTRMAEDAGILLRSADQYALIHDQVPHAVRLAIPGQTTMAELEAGLASLTRLLANPPSDMAV
jgi:DNA-binding transcriptional MocR family regulator